MPRLLAPLLLFLAALAVACGGDDVAASGGTTTTTVAVDSTVPAAVGDGTTTTVSSGGDFPVTLQSDAGEVILPAAPERIVALSATHVEMLYAIGAGDLLVAGDLFSNHPAEAAELEQIDSFNLSVERVIALDPDLVILSFDPVDAVPALEAVGIPTLLFITPPGLDAVYGQIATLGAATGHPEDAAALIDQMQSDIAAIVAAVGDAGSGVTYYHETDPFSFYTPNSSSFIGQLYGLLGMENIADAAPDELGSGFPQLSPEYIISSDPDLIFLATAGESLETVAARDGWKAMTAVAAGNVFSLDPDVASRWGPRVVEMLRAIAAALDAS